MNQKFFWICLSNLETISRKKIYELWKKKDKLSYERGQELYELLGIKKDSLNRIREKRYQDEIRRKLDWMKNHNIFTIFLDEEEYPKSLKKIYDPPIVIYGKGNKEKLKQFSLAMVGCRKYSLYGERIAYSLAKGLSQREVVIVSGLAKGIDTFSHQGSLQGEGGTIAILGNGLDKIYPKENEKLAKEILERKGTILSEYLVGTPPSKYHFPARNRLISGIGQGIIVVEAKEKSGTMLTVEYGLEQGKNIFAIPGNLGQKNSVGTNQLIKEGAKIVTSIEDILEEY